MGSQDQSAASPIVVSMSRHRAVLPVKSPESEADLRYFTERHEGPCVKCHGTVRPRLTTNVFIADPFTFLRWLCDCGWEAPPTRTADAQG